MKYITHLVRILVGGLFILSGFLKLVDPRGFGYKLEEYFDPDVFDMLFLAQYSLELSVFFVILEVILGFFLLLGVFKRFTLVSLLGLTVFFTFLTFYSAYFNKVTDCGCFGDALKLTPWESFRKDVILLILILLLIIGRKHIKSLFSQMISYPILGIMVLICSYISYQGINHLPIIDFRPFAVGNNIEEGMRVPPGAKQDSIQIMFQYELNGEILEFGEDELGEIPEGAIYKDRIDKLIVKGFKPAIKADFRFDCKGGVKTNEFLAENQLVVFVIPILDELNQEGFTKIQKLSKALNQNGIKTVGAVNGQIESANFEVCTMDGTMLKTMIRSNPGIMILSKGTILAKYHHNDIPTVHEIQQLYKN